MISLRQFLAEHDRHAVAWDRDIPTDTRWATKEDGCQCDNLLHCQIWVYDHTDFGAHYQTEAYVTNGHGIAFSWIADESDPLGGRWTRHSGRSFVILGNKVRYLE